MTILAHPDDAEVWAGGTILNHRSVGDEVLICTFSLGNLRRAEEALKGSQVLGARLVLIEETGIVANAHLANEVAELIHTFQPATIITHWREDTHDEHRDVFTIVNRATARSRIEHDLPHTLYMCDTYNSLGLSGPFMPTKYVDVTEEWQTKCKAIAVHESQDPPFWQEMITRQARLHGGRVGVDYAEAFCEIPILGHLTACKNLS